MQANEIVDKRFAEPACRFGGKIQTGREMPTKDDAVDRLHDIERRADHGSVVAIEKHFGSRRIDGVKVWAHEKCAAHVWGRSPLASDRRPPKNQFLGA